VGGLARRQLDPRPAGAGASPLPALACFYCHWQAGNAPAMLPIRREMPEGRHPQAMPERRGAGGFRVAVGALVRFGGLLGTFAGAPRMADSSCEGSRGRRRKRGQARGWDGLMLFRRQTIGQSRGQPHLRVSRRAFRRPQSAQRSGQVDCSIRASASPCLRARLHSSLPSICCGRGSPRVSAHPRRPGSDGRSLSVHLVHISRRAGERTRFRA